MTVAAHLALSEETLADLRVSLRGPVVMPDDSDYDLTRALFNAMIDKRPGIIVRASSVADVIAAVNFARDHGLLLAVRGGGHSGPGLGSCDGGMMLDLSLMNGVRVDPEKRTAQVEGGALLGDLDHATRPFGLVSPSGIISTTGVGGITLGGGIGNFTRTFGLAIDNLLEADVVLADGSFVTASADNHPDLFWALRGGGGNFGVVTSFLFKLHKLDSLIAGPMLWPVAQATEVLRWYRDFLPAQTDDLNGFFAFLVVPPGPPFPEELWNTTTCGVIWSYTGSPENADAVFGPIRAKFGGPVVDWVGPIAHEALQSMFDALNPPGIQWYWKAHCFAELSDAAIDKLVEHGQETPTMNSLMHLYPIDGAAGRVDKDATAWSNRGLKWAQVIVGANPDPADNPRTRAWARAYWDAMAPYSAGGGYVNFMMEEGADPGKNSYGDHYARLAAIKKQYDPGNLFRVNQNIKPA